MNKFANFPPVMISQSVLGYVPEQYREVKVSVQNNGLVIREHYLLYTGTLSVHAYMQLATHPPIPPHTHTQLQQHATLCMWETTRAAQHTTDTSIWVQER